MLWEMSDYVKWISKYIPQNCICRTVDHRKSKKKQQKKRKMK